MLHKAMTGFILNPMGTLSIIGNMLPRHRLQQGVLANMPGKPATRRLLALQSAARMTAFIYQISMTRQLYNLDGMSATW